MEEKEFFATGGPVDVILEERGLPKWGQLGREAMLEAWFADSTDHHFDAVATADGIMLEVEQCQPLGLPAEEEA